ncbi:MAG: tetratricopeptide repeat protein, partial [Actinomyces sp.]|nr:tetratricopeptide repeat protein [Actinomyces sp.]
EEAITLFEQVLPDRIRVLGEDHPDTLSSRNNLAGAYHAMGRLEEATTLFEQVTKDCARILGEDHALTKTVRENLEAARRELAQREDRSPTEKREEN